MFLAVYGNQLVCPSACTCVCVSVCVQNTNDFMLPTPPAIVLKVS